MGHLMFLLFFSLMVMRNLGNQDVYWTEFALTSQAVEMEFMEQDAPTWGKAFKDVATVQEFGQCICYSET